MALYIATLAEVKADLAIADTTDDAVLTRWLEGLQGRFDACCGRRFLYSSEETEILDGGVKSLFVRRWPIASMSAVAIDVDQDWTDEDNVLDSDDYIVEHRRGALLYGRGFAPWPEGRQCIRLVYAGGFVTNLGAAASYVDAYELQTLKRAFLMQGEFEWRNRRTLGLSQVSQNGTALSIAPAALLPDVASALASLARVL